MTAAMLTSDDSSSPYLLIVTVTDQTATNDILMFLGKVVPI